MNKNIDYYNTHAIEFYKKTITSDLADNYKAFEKYLAPQSHILDAGCGVGRDSKYFISQGYKITAFDASIEMVTIAKKETGIETKVLTFQQMNFIQEFDAVWSQASLIHVPYNETRNIYRKIHQSLKPRGIFYSSYKYGNNLVSTAERDFWNMDEKKILPYINGIFDILRLYRYDKISRTHSGKQNSWLICIARKK